MEIDEIRAIVELMSKHNLSEFKVEAENMHLCMKRETGNSQQAPIQQAAPAPAPTPQQATAPEQKQESKSEASEEEAKETIDAPIVGTFYRAPSPDSEAYVKVGDQVEKDSVVCVIEAMKVMNEIKAEKPGKIKEILVENAQSVEYGCPLFVLE